MIETCFFQCKTKGKMLAIYFDKKEEITLDFLSQFLNSDQIDRYVEFIYRNKGKEKVSYLIKSELDKINIINEVLNFLVKDEELVDILDKL